MGDLHTLEWGIGKTLARSLDEFNNLLRAVTDTSLVPDTRFRHTVKIFGTDRQSDNKIRQLCSVFLDCGVQCLQFVVNVVRA